MNQENRRNFLKQASLMAGAPAILPFLSNSATNPSNSLEDKPETVILFQGDSITDARRDRAAYYANNGQGMGDGYVFLAAAQLLASRTTQNFQIYNRGISGNKVFQLANRWKDDCLNLKPAVLSILIGVNDFWHTLNGNYDGTVEIYEKDFRALLDRTKEALPEVQLIIGEPFAVKGGRAINERWGADFDAYRAAAKQIATDYKAQFIPYHTIFADALNKASVEYWCPDGVHPSMAGAQLMAKHWLEAFEKI